MMIPPSSAPRHPVRRYDRPGIHGRDDLRVLADLEHAGGSGHGCARSHSLGRQIRQIMGKSLDNTRGNVKTPNLSICQSPVACRQSRVIGSRQRLRCWRLVSQRR